MLVPNTVKKPRYRINWSELMVIAIPFAIYFVLTTPLLDWLMDDAGISFAYSRSLAQGHGLVTQPGMAPVEGYSNFLWVLLMAPFFLLGIFDPFITSKTVSCILIAATFWILHKSIQTTSGSRSMVSFIVLLFLCFNTSFVYWTCSGLENPLSALLVSMLLYLQIKFVTRSTFRASPCILIAVVALGIALTRPDGLVYAVAFPFVLFTVALSKRSIGLWDSARGFLIYFGCYALGYGGFLLFRWLYFHDLYPNSYYVKRGPEPGDLVKLVTLQEPYLTKLQGLLASIAGSHLWLLISLALVLWVGLMVWKRIRWQYDLTLLSLTALSAVAYLLLTLDWMGEYRFATPFFPLLYSSLAVFGYRLVGSWATAPTRRRVWAGLVVTVLVATALSSHVPRLRACYKYPKVPFSGIAEAFAAKFDGYAEILELENASVLLADLGGTLYYSKLRIYDLAGLCDRTIAKTRRKNQKAFYDYVFDEIKPTIIHTSAYFTVQSRFDEDERFQRDYTAIEEYEDKYAEGRLKRKVMSGDYIRRDAAAGKEEELVAIREGRL